MTDQESTIAVLKKIFTGLPRLDGARCVGKYKLFDARGVDEEPDVARQRHEHAVALCRRCPALDDCRTFTATERDVGQVRAGQLPKPAQRVGRPKRVAE